MQPGELLALDVAPARWAVLRVLAVEQGDACVVLTSWSGPAGTSLGALRRNAALFTPQPLTHHKWSRPALGAWVKPPTLEALTPVGRVPLRRGEAARFLHPSAWVSAPRKTVELARRVLPVSSWAQLLDQARKQWRWDHDRAGLLEEEEAAQVARVAALQAAMARNAEAERAEEAAGLEGLVRHRFLPAWADEKPPALARAAEKLFRDAVKDLRQLPARSAPKRLRGLVTELNALYARYELDGDDAEDLLDALERLLRATPLTARQVDALDALREF
jgi:hypothetical protein